MLCQMEESDLPESSSKRCKFSASSGESKDIISGLPEAILHNILSFLPTKHAVQTCVLSRRWKYLWSSCPNLDLDHSLFDSLPFRDLNDHLFLFPQLASLTKTNFVDFVDMVLILRDISSIQKFHLACFYYFYKSHVNAWILHAIRRNVRELDFCICLEELYDTYVLFPGFSSEEPVNLPHALFTCDSLEVLKLSLKWSILKLPSTVSFYKLKTLRLMEVAFSDDHSTTVLFSSCPVLESLYMKSCTLHEHKNLNVSADKLKRLTISNCYGLKKCKLNFSAPSLISFKYVKTSMAQDYCLENLSSLADATFDFGASHCPWVEDGDSDSEEVYGYRLNKILRGIYNVKDLTLCCWCVQYLSKVPDLFDNLWTASFNNLKHLKLSTGLYRKDIQVLTCLLHRSPVLESLEMDSIELSTGDGDIWEAEFAAMKATMNHLMEVKIRLFMGTRNELELVKYLLTYARDLQKLTIISPSNEGAGDEKIKQQLLAFPRAASVVNITICNMKSFCETLRAFDL